MLALLRAREEQRDDIRASDKKKERDRSKEEPQRSARFAHGGFFQRLNADCDAGVGFRELASELRLDRGEISARLVDTDSGLKAANNREPGEFAILRIRKPGGNWRPKVNVAVREMEGRRHHANYGKQPAVQTKRFADDAGVRGK